MKSDRTRIVIHLPIIQNIKNARKLYFETLGWEKVDNLLYGVFSKNPDNTDVDVVFFKTDLIDSLYRCNLRMDKTKIAHEIVNVKLDLQNGDVVKNVKTIANIKPGHKRLGDVFASKYCHFHHPLRYPIVDSFTRRGLKHLTGKSLFNYERSYRNFVTDLELVRSRIGTMVSYKDMDIYLYLLGQFINYRKGKMNMSTNAKAVFESRSHSELKKLLL